MVVGPQESLDRSPNYSAFELGSACPRLRDDLQFSVRTAQSGLYYVIEDESSGKFYRIGTSEYLFLSLLDGNTSVQQAIAVAAQQLGAEAFTEVEAAALCKWLIDSGLVHRPRYETRAWEENERRQRNRGRFEWLNPIMLKIPLGNPDRWFAFLSRKMGWLVNRYLLLLWFVFCFLALGFVTARLERWDAQTAVLSGSNWLWLGLTWLGLRVIHETSHAVVCKRYGGTVREWGVMLLLFVPLPYVDVTSAWRFPRKSARLLTSAAGMLSETFLASVAALLWSHTQSGLLQQHAMNVMISASVTTLLFNANPLMRFDGYHMVADWWDMPNLWTSGKQFVRSIGRRVFFGLKTQATNGDADRMWLVRVYGVSAAIWKLVVTLTLLVAAMSLFRGAGLLLALIAFVLWIGVPLYGIVRFLVVGTPTEQPHRIQFLVATGGAVATLVLGFCLIPAPTVVRAPFVIQHDRTFVVRPLVGGFIQELHVKTGQAVLKDQVLCVLRDVELRYDIEEARLQVRESSQRMRAYQLSREVAALQIEQETYRDLRHQLQQLQDQADGMIILAPFTGVVLAGGRSERQGTYVPAGSELLVIGDQGPRKAIGLVAQNDAKSVRAMLGAVAKLRLWGDPRGTLEGRVSKIKPRAETTLPHFALAAPAGGPLDVLEQTSDSTDATRRWKLARPRLQVEICLNDTDSTMLAGQTGTVALRLRSESLGPYLVHHARRWLGDRLQFTYGM